MGGAKDAIVVRSEEVFQLSGRVWHWFQGSYSCWHDCLLKSFPHSKRTSGRLINKRGELFSLEMGRKGHFPYVISHFSFFIGKPNAEALSRKGAKTQKRRTAEQQFYCLALRLGDSAPRLVFPMKNQKWKMTNEKWFFSPHTASSVTPAGLHWRQTLPFPSAIRNPSGLPAGAHSDSSAGLHHLCWEV